MVLEIQFQSVNHVLGARICKNFEQNKPCWLWCSRWKQHITVFKIKKAFRVRVSLIILHWHKNCFSTLIRVTLQDLWKIYEKLIAWGKGKITLNNFKKWSSTALNTFSNYAITNSGKIRIWVVFSSVVYFWVNSTGCSGEVHILFQHFQTLENLILNILKENLFPCALFFP